MPAGRKSPVAVPRLTCRTAACACLPAPRPAGTAPPCTPIAPTPAARCAPPMPARPPASPAGCTASATTAACCSSTCATITASRSACSHAELAGLRGGRGGAAGERDHRHRRRSCARAAEHRQPEACRPARSSCASSRSGVQSAAEVLPMQVAGDEEFPEEHAAAATASSICAASKLHRNIMLRSQVIASHPPAHDRAGLHRVPDADPDRDLARGRARLPGAGAAASRQVLRAAAGAAAVQAAADGRRLRPLLPDRALLPRRGQRAPTARPASSTSSTSRCAS